MSDYTDMQLVEGFRSQDDHVIRYIYQKIGPLVRNLVIKGGGSDAEAEDIFQEGLVAAYINIKNGKYARQQAKFSSYLIQICKFRWFDLVKSSHRKKGGVMLDINMKDKDPDIQFALEEEQKHEVLHSLIDTLNEQCKEIILRYYWEHQSLSEISQALGMAPASVKNGKYRCMQQLKKNALDKKHLLR